MSSLRFIGRFFIRVLHNYGLTCLDNRWRLMQAGICLRRSHAIWWWRVEIFFPYIKTKRKDILTFCDKTITKLKPKIEKIDQNLKNILKSNKYQEVQNTTNSSLNIRDRSLKQCKLKKLNHLKYGPRQTQQYSPRDEESTREDQTTEKRRISYAAAARKGNSKTNLFRKKSNTNIRKPFNKTSSNENNQTPVSQQIDLRQRQ